VIPAAPRVPLVLAVLVVLAVISSPLVAAAPVPGWNKVDIPATGSYFWRYVPTTLDAARPAPLVLFFHGAGGSPEGYKDFVLEAVEAAGCVVALPKSSGLGWGTEADDRTVAETLRLVRQELTVDDTRIALAGHSAGGAYAYLLAYADRRYSAVFTLSAPWYDVASLADPAYKAPIHMYYGTTDPNFTGGAYAKLKAQWNRLGVPWEDDVQAGFSHNTWPVASMINGFLFLASKSRAEPTARCVPGDTTLCLNRGRFKVEVSWDVNGSSGHGRVVPGASVDSGLFWFFGPDNWELMVKVLDACSQNNRYWVFAAATTDVHYVLTVTDTLTNSFKRYESPAGKPSAATTDTGAFPTCP
jgi:pimeloyl-ACP methyl ester carboxylesterase